jgi:hypothetical protein
MLKPCVAISAFALSTVIAHQARGQSFNVDIGTSVSTGAGFGTPTMFHRSGANQPGFWNNLAGITQTSLALMNVAGNPTSVTLMRSTASGGDFHTNNANTNGDAEKLLDDAQDLSGTPGVPVTYTFSNLEAGNYEVYTYAVAPDLPTDQDVTSVTINGVTQNVTGPIPFGNNYVQGVTYAKHMVNGVPQGGSITISAVRGNSTSYGTVNGFQLVRLATCTGDIAPPGGNAKVDIDDLFAVIRAWGPCPAPCPPSCPADIVLQGPMGACFVNIDDLFAVINAWGPCPGPLGACCMGTQGNCSQMTQANCAAAGGSFAGQGARCTTGLCQGACCIAGNCSQQTQSGCTSSGGTFQGLGTFCSGVTCPPVPPANDECSSPADLGVGNTVVIAWNNGAATTDAGVPQTPASCNVFGSTGLYKDVWFLWTAGPDADGMVRVQTCADPGFDNKMAMYLGAGCPSADPIACNDQGTTICTQQPSRAAFDVMIVPGQRYLIRVGSYLPTSSSGPGTLQILGNDP